MRTIEALIDVQISHGSMGTGLHSQERHQVILSLGIGQDPHPAGKSP